MKWLKKSSCSSKYCLRCAKFNFNLLITKQPKFMDNLCHNSKRNHLQRTKTKSSDGRKLKESKCSISKLLALAIHRRQKPSFRLAKPWPLSNYITWLSIKHTRIRGWGHSKQEVRSLKLRAWKLARKAERNQIFSRVKLQISPVSSMRKFTFRTGHQIAISCLV